MIPEKFIEVAEHNHDGQSSYLYAVASTGDLTPGTQRPYNDDENRPMTDAEWKVHLWSGLDCELCATLRQYRKRVEEDAEAYAELAEELPKLEAFQEFAETMTDLLREKYGIE